MKNLIKMILLLIIFMGCSKDEIYEDEIPAPCANKVFVFGYSKKGGEDFFVLKYRSSDCVPSDMIQCGSSELKVQTDDIRSLLGLKCFSTINEYKVD